MQKIKNDWYVYHGEQKTEGFALEWIDKVQNLEQEILQHLWIKTEQNQVLI